MCRPEPIVGLIDDFWQRSITDLGLARSRRDKGGKFLLLPPGYTGEVPQSGLPRPPGDDEQLQRHGPRHRRRTTTLPAAVNVVKKLRVYPWSERDNPKPNKFVSMSGKTMNTIPPDGIEYWERLSAFINNNPVHERDRFYMAMLKPLGIEKGKPFKPDARQRAILEDAATDRRRDGSRDALSCRAAHQQRRPHFPAPSGTGWSS